MAAGPGAATIVRMPPSERSDDPQQARRLRRAAVAVVVLVAALVGGAALLSSGAGATLASAPIEGPGYGGNANALGVSKHAGKTRITGYGFLAGSKVTITVTAGASSPGSSTSSGAALIEVTTCSEVGALSIDVPKLAGGMVVMAVGTGIDGFTRTLQAATH